MIIDCIADLHGFYPKLEGGDLLIVAGDLTARDSPRELDDFCEWLCSQEYKRKIIVPGNHDNQIETYLLYEDMQEEKEEFLWHGEYLCDSGIEFEGLKIWGSPWTKTFEGMNPHCKAFTFDTEEELAEKFALIPDDVDILITHSPPFTIRDKTIDRRQVGSIALMAHHMKRLNPKLWGFGHIHEDYGEDGPYEWNNTKYVNASLVNERYELVNKPVRVIL